MAAINTGGIILPDYAQSMIDGEMAYRQRQAANQQQAEYQRQITLRDNTDQARSLAASGNYKAARDTAASGYNWAAYDALDEQNRAMAQRQIESVASLAFDLKNIKDPAQRQAVFDSRAGQLRTLGLDDNAIMAARNNVTDDGYLDGYIGAGTSFKEKLAEANKIADDNRALTRDLSKPITAQDGAVLLRNASGGFDTLYTPGTKAQQGTYQDAMGNQHIYNIPGTAGTSYNPSAGGGSAQKQEMVQYMTTKGYTPAQAEGIVNNLHYESGGGNHQAVGDGGQAYGLAQWHAPRQADFKRVMGVDIRNSTPQQQLDFVDWELRNTERGAGAALMNAKTPAEATEIVMRQYERPANMSSLAQRQGGGGGRSTPASSQAGGVVDINLGGGFSGARTTETREEIGGQMYSVQTDAKTGEKKYQALGAKPGANKAPNEGQAKAASFAKRMETANNNIQKLYVEGYKAQSGSADLDRRVGNIPYVGGYLMSSQGQRQAQAERAFINALLRRESGAAIGKDEFRNYEKEFFPRPGDSPAVLSQKSNARTQAVANMKSEAGSAGTGSQSASKPSSNLKSKYGLK